MTKKQLNKEIKKIQQQAQEASLMFDDIWLKIFNLDRALTDRKTRLGKR